MVAGFLSGRHAIDRELCTLDGTLSVASQVQALKVGGEQGQRWCHLLGLLELTDLAVHWFEEPIQVFLATA